MPRAFVLVILLLTLSGCATHAYTNVRLAEERPGDGTRASFTVEPDRGSHARTLGILALSGGGSRAAYFSAAMMLALEGVYADEGLNILGEVDALSSVSGGSLPAAYYAISYSRDALRKAPSGRLWDRKTVKGLMSRSYRSSWVASWFWPPTAARYWFTAFDRSDIMAEVFADALFDTEPGGVDLRLADLNPDRPNLILNASNGTTGRFADRFTFTREDFSRLAGSEINDYKLSRAVMASASYPGVFHYMTLRDFRATDKPRYLHVFDGGVTDNLGLDSVVRLLDVNGGRYDRVFIILVDAHVGLKGGSPEEYDARRFWDYGVNRNLLDSVKSLLEGRRREAVDGFPVALEEYGEKDVVFYHVEFDDVGAGELLKRLKSIKTDFNIKPGDVSAIDEAVGLLAVKENACLVRIRDMLLGKDPGPGARKPLCKWRPGGAAR